MLLPLSRGGVVLESDNDWLSREYTRGRGSGLRPRETVPRLVPLLPPWSAGSRHPGAWERSPRAGRAGPSVCLPRVDRVLGT